jgi:hypothetical protein
MKDIKEKAIKLGCWFKDKTSKTSYPETWIPYFNVKTCKGKGNPNECGSPKYHQRIRNTNIWKTVCLKCNRKWKA